MSDSLRSRARAALADYFPAWKLKLIVFLAFLGALLRFYGGAGAAVAAGEFAGLVIALGFYALLATIVYRALVKVKRAVVGGGGDVDGDGDVEAAPE